MDDPARRPILLNTRWSAHRTDSGRFHCPHCRAERAYTGTSLQSTLMVLERPMLKLGPPEDFVTCDECGHAWPAAQASSPAPGEDVPTEGVLAEDELALLAIVAAMVFSDSVVRRSEKKVAREIVQRYTGRTLDLDEMDGFLGRARRRWGDAVTRLARVRWLVPVSIRCRIVAAAYHICTADGELHREESRLLDRIGDALDLPPRKLRDALLEAKRNPVVLRG